MKVSRIILALIASAIVATSYAESNDSIKLVRLEQTLQKEIKARESLKTELAIQKDLIKNQAGVIDSLRSAIDQNARNIKTAADVEKNRKRHREEKEKVDEDVDMEIVDWNWFDE